MGDKRKQQQKKKKGEGAKLPKRPWIPLGIGSYRQLVDDNVIFGDYKFTHTGPGSYEVTFRGAGCRNNEPPPVIFTNAGGDRHVGVQGWGCEKGRFSVYFTAEENGQMTDFDFDWVVYRG